MSTKSKRRATRRHSPGELEHVSKKLSKAEREAAGAIGAAMLAFITLGAVTDDQDATPSQSQPRMRQLPT